MGENEIITSTFFYFSSSVETKVFWVEMLKTLIIFQNRYPRWALQFFGSRKLISLNQTTSGLRKNPLENDFLFRIVKNSNDHIMRRLKRYPSNQHLSDRKLWSTQPVVLERGPTGRLILGLFFRSLSGTGRYLKVDWLWVFSLAHREVLEKGLNVDWY